MASRPVAPSRRRSAVAVTPGAPSPLATQDHGCLFPLVNHLGEEPLDARVVDVAEHFADRPIGNHPAGFHEDRAICNTAREFHLVGHQDHGRAGFRETLDDDENFGGHFRIERRSHFVEKQMPRLHGQRPADADALLLAAGKFRRIGVGAIAEANHLQQFEGLRLRARRAAS